MLGLNIMGLLLLPNGDVEVTKNINHLIGKKHLLCNNRGWLVCGNIPVETDKQRKSMRLFSSLTMGQEVESACLPMFYYVLNKSSDIMSLRGQDEQTTESDLFMIKLLVEEDPPLPPSDPEPDPEVEWLKKNLPLSYYVRSIVGHKELT